MSLVFKKFPKHSQEQMALAPLSSFLSPPEETSYFDSKTASSYINPDHRKLIELAGKYFLCEGEYKGIGLTRRKLVCLQGTETLCDILFLTKQQDQIDYESKHKISFSNLSGKITKRIAKQGEIYEKACREINRNLKSWGYETFKWLDTPIQLGKAGFSEHDSKKVDAIAFFYKKVSPKEVALCGCAEEADEMQGRGRAHSQSAMDKTDGAAGRRFPPAAASTSCLGLSEKV